MPFKSQCAILQFFSTGLLACVADSVCYVSLNVVLFLSC